jgi:transcriptional regulator with XRE-family HTH domain
MLMIRDDVTATLVRNLQRLMNVRTINAHDLAARAGMNPTAVYDIISGKARSPKLETVAKLAAALNVTPSTLIEAPGASSMRNDIETIFALLSPEEQARIVTIAQALLTAQEQT